MKTVQHMLSALNAEQITDAAVAEECAFLGLSITQATVNRLRNGKHKSTNYQTYATIEALYKRVMRKAARKAA